MKKLLKEKTAFFLFAAMLSAAFLFLSVPLRGVLALASDEQPHGISVTFNGDAYSQRGIAWVAGKGVTDCRVEVIEKSLAEDKENIDWQSAEVTRFSGRTDISNGVRIKEKYTAYKALVTGLQAGKGYYFRIYSPAHTAASKTGEFNVEKRDAGSLSFINYTDPQEGSKAGYEAVAKVLRGALREQPDASFLMCGGDNVNSSHTGQINLDEWNYYFDTADDVFLNRPVVSTAGNHESTDYAFTDRFYNDFAGAKSAWTNGGYYSFDYADAHFVVLNTNDGSIQGAQTEWLKNDLASTDKTWKFVQVHWAPVTVGRYAGDSLTVKLRELLMPIMAQYEVDVLFSGHNHCYMRTNPYSWMASGSPVTDAAVVREIVDGVSTDFLVEPGGTVYALTNMSGNKQYEAPNLNNASVANNPVSNSPAASGFNADNNSGDFSGQNPTFVTVDIDFSVNRLVYKTYLFDRSTDTATLYDVFGMYKDTHKPVERLIEKLPEIADFSLDDTPLLKQTSDAFNALTVSAIGKISVENRERLASLLEEVDMRGNFLALNAEEKIRQIGDVVYDENTRKRIADAEFSYGDLTYAQKQSVRNYALLTAANAKFLDLTYAHGVSDFIGAISPGGEDFALRVISARTAYNRLTAAQKAYVENIGLLQEYERQQKEGGDIGGAGCAVIRFDSPFPWILCGGGAAAFCLLLKRRKGVRLKAESRL